MSRLVLSSTLACLCACGGVAQKRRTFPVEVTHAAPAAANDSGWAVTLTKATAKVAPVRFFTGKVLLSSRWEFDPYLLIGGTAWAHPGHYLQGDALGELLTPKDLDLLAATPTELGLAEAVTGDYGSMQLTLDTVQLAGTATKDSVTVKFDTGAFTPPAPIEGVRFEKILEDEKGTARLTALTSVWLSRIDFSTAGTPNADGVSVFSSDSVAFNGFVRGVLDTSAYDVKWVAP